MARRRKNFRLPVMDYDGKGLPQVKTVDSSALSGPERRKHLDEFARLMVDDMRARDLQYLIGRLSELTTLPYLLANYPEAKAALEGE
jgi:hypothetical protein